MAKVIDVFIKYNPYRLETEVRIDNKVPKQNSRLNVGDRRLQEWVEELPEILYEECSSRNFKLTFQGTLLDYEDVEAMARDAKQNGMSFELVHIPAKEIGDKEKAISDIFMEIQAGPFEELRAVDLKKAFMLAKSSDFEVNVVATMSAGKSTLINALLRQKLLPAKQEACTATITEIKDNDSDNFIAKAYDANNQLVQTHANLSFKIMDDLNNNPAVSRVRIEGNIPFVTSEDISLVLVDTPGPNNSRDPEHRAKTYRMLSESSKALVLYIMNATQLGVNDDYNLISTVADSMKVGGKQSRDRFIFVVNKLDDFKKGEDSIEGALSKVRDYLRDNGIENPNIYPASALTALDIRTTLAVSDDDDDDAVYEAKGKVRKFNRNEEMHFEKLAPLTPSVRGQIEEMLAKARENKDTKAEALIHCGIIPIEMAIRMYVQKYAKTAKIKNIVDTFSSKLESAKSFEKTKQEIATQKDKQEEVLKQIDEINAKLSSGDEARDFKERIKKIDYTKEINQMTNAIITKSQERITAQIGATEPKMSPRTAAEECKRYARFAENLQAEIEAKLEDVIFNYVQKSANTLLEEYKKKLSALVDDVNIGEVTINPFDMMSGDIRINSSSIIQELTQTEQVKVGEKWVENKSKKWYKPWTWFDDDGYYKDVYENREYVDGTELAQRFFAPIQEQIYENKAAAVDYAQEQTYRIKSAFTKKFDELDVILKEKLEELKACTDKSKNIEDQIKESENRLKWLQHIQAQVNAILDI
jgi:GTPase Era involved in 16S rRNA processing/5'-deoxynucleotidase YfbR-like HD superfamily hydrolase